MAAEIQALAALVEGPLCAERLACGLGRELIATQEFLDALVAIGVLEREGEGYAATPAARMYLQTFVDC
jgi:predicted transcriptional regulator